MPYGPKGETLVTYYNRIRKGRIKICKLIPYTSQDSLGGKTFDFDWRVDGRSGTVHAQAGRVHVRARRVAGDRAGRQPDAGDGHGDHRWPEHADGS